MTCKTAFEGPTGRTLNATAGLGTATTVLNQQVQWDSLNNLTQRTDFNGDGTSGAVTETFAYLDSLNRLTGYTVNGAAIPTGSRTVTLQYNALGLLLYKTDVGNYAYPAQGATSVRPHAVQTVTGAIATTYGYDANGNLVTATAGPYRSLSSSRDGCRHEHQDPFPSSEGVPRGGPSELRWSNIRADFLPDTQGENASITNPSIAEKCLTLAVSSGS